MACSGSTRISYLVCQLWNGIGRCSLHLFSSVYSQLLVNNVHLDMTIPEHQCPPLDWRYTVEHLQTMHVKETLLLMAVSLLCFQHTDRSTCKCVCGKIKAYQYAHPAGFRSYIWWPTLTLEDSYVSGVSLTHGSAGSRKHIWIFATSVIISCRAHVVTRI